MSSAWRPLVNLGQAIWWKNALTASFCFAPHCIVPAVVWSVVGLVVFGGVGTIPLIMTDNPQLTQLLECLGILVLTLVTALTLIFWGLSAWLVRLTAFCRALTVLPQDILLSPALDQSALKEQQKEALAEVRRHKAQIASVWFFITLYMSVPLALLLTVMTAKCLATPEIIGMQLFTIPPWLDLTMMALGAALALFITVLSLIALAASSHFDRSAKECAGRAFALTCKFFLPAGLVTIIFVTLNVFISTPSTIIDLQHPQRLLATKWDTKRMIIEHCWQALTSMMLWTLTATPLCALVKEKFEEGSKTSGGIV